MNSDNKETELTKTKKIISIPFIIILIVCISLFTIIKHNSNDTDVVASENELGSSYYLQLKDDPNADDALIVSKNMNDLFKGYKQYPVRNDRKKVVYLTFDDGPSTTNTPALLKILDEHNIKATFFITGVSLNANDKAKELLKEIATNGHAIGNHTYSHNYHYLYPSRTINVDHVIDDLNKNEKLMQSILGKDFFTRIVRLPGGYRTWNGKEALKKKLNELEIQNIDWNALNGDAEGTKKNAQELVMYLKKTVKKLGEDADNIVVLMHDAYGKDETIKALPQIIKYFKDKGFEFKTIK